jgi:DNA-binding phage protein
MGIAALQGSRNWIPGARFAGEGGLDSAWRASTPGFASDAGADNLCGASSKAGISLSSCPEHSGSAGLDLISSGNRIAERRNALDLSQTALARKARVSRATLDALENGRAGELGFSKVTKLLAALGLELTLQPASSQRPTLDELMQEDRDDQGQDPRL